MAHHAKIILTLVLVIGSVSWALAGEDNKTIDGTRHRSPATQRAVPVKLFEGRDAGPNELYRVCVIDEGGGRVRRCGAAG